jgi:tRNA threonylcarbamoyladenosine modification (KEOPS) complex  Pcc1 subunit
LEATLALEYDDEKVAEAVAAAISPDNYKTPADLTVKTVRKQNIVLTEIRAEGKMATFIATIDDLLFSISTAEKALRTVQKG